MNYLISLTAFLLLSISLPVQATVVRLTTSIGLIDIRLFDEQAPLTVTNFLNYVQRGDYDNSFIHRSVPGFVIQGGGYGIDYTLGRIVAVVTDPPVVNEYDSARSNLRGTIAMAKQPDLPDSATSQWFFNLKDNSANLNNQNGGFTVFGEVMGRSMELIDAIAGLTIVNAGGDFTALPVLSQEEDGSIAVSQLVRIARAAVLPTSAAAEVDRLFNYLEQQFPEFIAPAGNVSASFDGYDYRYYSGTDSFVGVKEGRLYSGHGQWSS